MSPATVSAPCLIFMFLHACALVSDLVGNVIMGVSRVFQCYKKSVLRNNNMAALSLCWPCTTKSILRVFLE